MGRNDEAEPQQPIDPESVAEGPAPGETVPPPPQPALQYAPLPEAPFQHIDAAAQWPHVRDIAIPQPIKAVEFKAGEWYVHDILSGVANLAVYLVRAFSRGWALPAVICIDARRVSNANEFLRLFQEFEAPMGDVTALSGAPPDRETVADIDALQDDLEPTATTPTSIVPVGFVAPRRVVLLNQEVYDHVTTDAGEFFGFDVTLVPAVAGVEVREAYEEFKHKALASFYERSPIRRKESVAPPPEARRLITPEQAAAFDEWVQQHRDDS